MRENHTDVIICCPSWSKDAVRIQKCEGLRARSPDTLDQLLGRNRHGGRGAGTRVQKLLSHVVTSVIPRAEKHFRCQEPQAWAHWELEVNKWSDSPQQWLLGHAPTSLCVMDSSLYSHHLIGCWFWCDVRYSIKCAALLRAGDVHCPSPAVWSLGFRLWDWDSEARP